ncbi:MAG: type II toxin-antitoxin system RelE/ParE family toxin [Spartobacteria bacterium]|nr:type II toxin-antitoxin system RelE/ParE family toxin [Spartobacteria bacterium]
MSMEYQVTWAAVAKNDLKTIIEYIATDSPDDALRLLKKIRQKANDLCTIPDRGRIVPELKNNGIHTYRELIIHPWRILYRTSKTKVFVLSVIDSRRNVEDILLDRLVK